MLNWLKKQKPETETASAQIHPTPKLPSQTTAISDRIVEDPNPRPPVPAEPPPAARKPPARSPISPLRKTPPTPPAATPPAHRELPGSTTMIALDDNGHLDAQFPPQEETDAAATSSIPFTIKPMRRPPPATSFPDEHRGTEFHGGERPSPFSPVEPLKPGADRLKNDPKLLYRQLLSGMYDAVVITDPKGQIIETNGRVHEIFQFNSSALWNAPIAKLVRGITPPLLARLRSNVDKHRHVLLDATCNRADGTTFAAEVAISGAHLMNEGDFVFSVRNVDKRHQTLARMKMYQNALERSPCPTGIATKAGVLLYGNPALATFLKCELASMDGFDFSGALADRSVASRIADAVADAGKWEGMATFTLPDGTTAEGLVLVTPDNISKEKFSNALIYIQPS